MTRTQDQIDAAARAVSRAYDEAAYVGASIHMGNTEEAKRHAKAAKEAASNALEVLLAMGATRPGGPLAEDMLRLDQLDTPASRRLLAAIEEAQAAGAALDRERGWMQDGEPCGWGETLGNMAHSLRREVHGPEGRGE